MTEARETPGMCKAVHLASFDDRDHDEQSLIVVFEEQKSTLQWPFIGTSHALPRPPHTTYNTGELTMKLRA